MGLGSGAVTAAADRPALRTGSLKVLDAPSTTARALADVLDEITDQIATYIECSATP